MIIQNIHPDNVDHLRDESRLTGFAETISFPENDEDVISVLKEMHTLGKPVTVQGSRTGLSGGAVPLEGHVINLQKMDSILASRPLEADDSYALTVQAGLLLSSLEEHLQNSSLSRYFFPPDPTETTASIGGIIACNSSGAASYLYGPARRYVNKLKVILADGTVLNLKRGQSKASGRLFSINTDDMKHLHGRIPGYSMPNVKNSAGYFAADDLDILDLFIGSEGTLGIITQAELILRPRPLLTWGMFFMLVSASDSVKFTESLKQKGLPLMSIEYFDPRSMEFVREQIPFKEGSCGVYTQLIGDDEAGLTRVMLDIAVIADEYGISEDDIFTACSKEHMDLIKQARHCVPEGINRLVDETRKTHPDVTKLASDIAVPDGRLNDMMDIYMKDLSKNDLIHAIFGHIGDNHLHVNIVARNSTEYMTGKSLIRSWCESAVSFGGTMSAEHGTGKLKKDYLRLMYSDADIDEMKNLKMVFDNKNILGRGNIF